MHFVVEDGGGNRGGTKQEFKKKKKSLSKAQNMTVLSPSYTAPTAAAAATAILTCWCGFGGHWTCRDGGSGCFIHVVYQWVFISGGVIKIVNTKKGKKKTPFTIISGGRYGYRRARSSCC